MTAWRIGSSDEAYQDMRDIFAAMRPAFCYQQVADVLNQDGDAVERRGGNAGVAEIGGVIGGLG